MKNLLFLCLAVCAILFTTSCTKEYTCTCTTAIDGSDDFVTTTVLDMTKSDAEDACALLAIGGADCVLD